MEASRLAKLAEWKKQKETEGVKKIGKEMGKNVEKKVEKKEKGLHYVDKNTSKVLEKGKEKQEKLSENSSETSEEKITQLGKRSRSSEGNIETVQVEVTKVAKVEKNVEDDVEFRNNVQQADALISLFDGQDSRRTKEVLNELETFKHMLKQTEMKYSSLFLDYQQLIRVNEGIEVEKNRAQQAEQYYKLINTALEVTNSNSLKAPNLIKTEVSNATINPIKLDSFLLESSRKVSSLDHQEQVIQLNAVIAEKDVKIFDLEYALASLRFANSLLVQEKEEMLNNFKQEIALLNHTHQEQQSDTNDSLERLQEQLKIGMEMSTNRIQDLEEERDEWKNKFLELQSNPSK